MHEEFPTSITIDDVTLMLIVQPKAVKNINVRLCDQTLRVSVPLHLSPDMLNRVLPDLARRLLRRQRTRHINSVIDALELARQVALRFPQPLAVSDVQFTTNQTACWGSYSTRTHAIRLNAVLRLMPAWVMEAVIAHELAHSIHANHSPAFWSLLRSVCPDTDRANAFLEGVNWLARAWENLPAIERAQLTHAPDKKGNTPA